MKTLSPVLLSFLFLCSFYSMNAQETRFFMPKEIAKAYENGTRSYDGRPGPNYWQNTVDYTIEMEVIPAEKKLTGTESVVYYNNSPDELERLVIRLYYDAFRKANARASRVRPDDITEGVEISRLTINGAEMDISNRRSVSRRGTNMYVTLPKPLTSGDKVTIEVDWAQQIPETSIRGGAYDSTSFFVSYWYPQIAVYDDVFGWDRLSYDFSTEFYNNLGNYDVKITAPDNFTVLSTGVLQNPEEVFADTLLKRYNEAKTATETVTIVGSDDLSGDFHHRSGSWHYMASEVSDFAFCLSDHFCWDAAAVKVTDRTVFVHSFYQLSLHEKAGKVTANQQKIMKHFSEDIPGIPYPYPEFTTFISGERGGGMEYPMMANNGGPDLGVTIHEMFHTYFPMYVRVNEKRFAWMDEGWADFTTSFVTRRFFDEEENAPLYGGYSSQIQNTLGSISDLPLITSTQFMDNSNYGYASYPLPAFLYAVLYHHLGEDTFLKCWRQYIRRWAKKSPTPYDFMYTFEDVSGQDLSWFWKPWFFNFGNVDVGIKSFKKGILVVENNGTRPVPLSLRIKFKDGSTKESDFSASIWQKGNTYKTKLARFKEIASLAINYNVPDSEILNNYYPTLRDQYGAFVIPDDILGTYVLNEFPASVIISIKNDLLYLEIPGGGFGNYLMPKPDGNFESLGGAMQIQFQKEDGKYIGLAIQVSGVEATASKE